MRQAWWDSIPTQYRLTDRERLGRDQQGAYLINPCPYSATKLDRFYARTKMHLTRAQIEANVCLIFSQSSAARFSSSSSGSSGGHYMNAAKWAADKRLEGKNDNLSYLLIARTMKPDLSALIASLAEIIARLKFVHHELQRLEKQKRKA